MKSDSVENLLHHMTWAYTEAWGKVLSFSAAENDERIKKLLYHLHQVQYAFLSLWNNKSIDLPKSETFSDLKSIAR